MVVIQSTVIEGDKWPSAGKIKWEWSLHSFKDKRGKWTDNYRVISATQCCNKCYHGRKKKQKHVQSNRDLKEHKKSDMGGKLGCGRRGDWRGKLA